MTRNRGGMENCPIYSLLLQNSSLELKLLCEINNLGAIVCGNWNGIESGIGKQSVAVHSIGRWLCESCNSQNWIRATVHPLLGSLAPMVLRLPAPGGGSWHLAAVHWLAEEEEGIRRHERDWRLQTRMKDLDLEKKRFCEGYCCTTIYNYMIWWNSKCIVILINVMCCSMRWYNNVAEQLLKCSLC